MRLQVHNTRVREGEHVWKTVDQYFQTYWSGLDARIYANDTLLDEVISLQWGLEEAVMPLFGYHDYVFRKAAHGSRRVQGAFTINFKRDSYLYELLRTLNQPAATQSQFAKVAHPSLTAAARDGNATLDDFMAYVSTGEGPSGPGKGQLRLDPERLSEVAHAFEDAIWQGLSPQADQSNSLAGLLKFTPANQPRFQLSEAFDLHVQFGHRRVRTGEADPQNPGKGRLLNTRQFNPEAGLVTDIDAPVPISTYTRLVGVELTGVSRLVDDSGRPILEAYTFLARDVL